MQAAGGNFDRNYRISLNKLAIALDLQSHKGDLDGSMVWDYYKAGRLEEIKTYCEQDVYLTRKIYNTICITG